MVGDLKAIQAIRVAWADSRSSLRFKRFIYWHLNNFEDSVKLHGSSCTERSISSLDGGLLSPLITFASLCSSAGESTVLLCYSRSWAWSSISSEWTTWSLITLNLERTDRILFSLQSPSATLVRWMLFVWTVNVLVFQDSTSSTTLAR